MNRYLRFLSYLMMGTTLALIQSGCMTASRKAETMPDIRVMTFNVRYRSARDGENGWENRKMFVAETIRDCAPDVLGVQESVRSQLDDIRNSLPEYSEVGLGRDGGTKGEYSAVLYRKERFDLTASGTFWLSKTPTKPSQDWGSACRRICTWAHLTDKGTGKSFFFYNTHLDHRSQEARMKGAQLIIKHALGRKPKVPLILTGDLNVGETDPVITFLTGDAEARNPQDMLFDTYRILHPDDETVGTYHGFKGERGGKKIDYIFVTPDIYTLQASIVRMDRDGRYPSDHFPVTATLRLKPREDL